jgi:hypothetical protein
MRLSCGGAEVHSDGEALGRVGVDADGDEPAVGIAVASYDDQRGRTGSGVQSVGLFLVEALGPDLLLDDLMCNVAG